MIKLITGAFCSLPRWLLSLLRFRLLNQSLRSAAVSLFLEVSMWGIAMMAAMTRSRKSMSGTLLLDWGVFLWLFSANLGCN
jgi:hypothetical protein